MMKTVAFAAIAGLAASASAQVTMNEVLRIDLDPNFNDTTSLGSNPAAVAWDGTDAYIAGFDNFSAGTNTGILRIADAFGLQTQSQFGILATPDGRGYSGLDISGGTLAAAYDSGGNDPNGLQAFDASGTQLWAKNMRGGSGTGFDPGFGGADDGVAWTTFGSGRRALQNSGSGADIYTTANGMIITPDFEGSFWRDMDFAPNGDMVARRSNDVTFLSRSGGNAGSASFLVDNAENGPFVGQQNVSYVYGSAAGDFVLYNDRPTSGTGQAAADVLTAVLVNPGTGLAPTFLTIDLNLIGGGALADGNGAYDFSWDAESGTLAMVDFANRNLHVFEVVPAPGTAALLGLGGLAATRRRRA